MKLKLSVAAVTVLVTACTSYVQRASDPAMILRNEHHRWVAVGTDTGEIFLQHPLAVRDSLIGMRVNELEQSGGAADWVVIPLYEIRWVGTRKMDGIKSFQLGLVIGVGVAVGVPLLSSALN